MAINSILMNKIIDEFIERMKSKGNGIISFGANSYYFDGEPGHKDGGEGYKLGMAIAARKLWNKQKFTPADIGKGRINETIRTLLSPQYRHNLVTGYQNTNSTFALMENNPTLAEALFYNVFESTNAELAFRELTAKIRRYDVVSTLFFFRDYSKFVPIATKTIDRIFYNLGIDFTATDKISWENYTTYLGYVRQVRSLLADRFEGDVTLLDAHSFLWIMQDSKYFTQS